MLVEIIIIFVLIILNGVFSMSEIALVSSKKFKLESEANNGSNKARQALKLANNPGKFLSTVQVGITLIGIFTGVYGGASIAERLANNLENINQVAPYSETIATVIVVIFITFFTLILGELFPKRLGLNSPETISKLAAGPMNFLSKLAKPIIWVLDKATEVLIYLFRIKKEEENFVTEEEIRSMLNQATEVDIEEREMVERVFFLGDTDVGSLMTPKSEVVLLDINAGIEQNKLIMADSIHTHFPVFEKSVDNIIGVLSLKTFSSAYIKNQEVEIRSILMKPLFVTETTKAFKLLEKMKVTETHFGIAVNEFGHVTGVVTSNDLFKVIAGNLYKREDNIEIVKRSDGTYLVDGLISLDEFFRYFKVENTEEVENKGFFTLGGLILYLAGHIPGAGEKLKWRSFKFEVVDMDGQRVDKVVVKEI